jgi:hypothetical protein
MAIKGSKRAKDRNHVARRHHMLEPVDKVATCTNCVATMCKGMGTVVCSDWTRRHYNGR